MATFQVGKDFETPENAGAEGFQVYALTDENENDVTNKIDMGIIFLNDKNLKEYLSEIFKIPTAQIDIDEL